MFASGPQSDTYTIFTLCYAPFLSGHGYIKEGELMDLTDVLGNSFQPELTNVDMYQKTNNTPCLVPTGRHTSVSSLSPLPSPSATGVLAVRAGAGTGPQLSFVRGSRCCWQVVTVCCICISLSSDTGNNSTCCMLNIADKIIKLASILVNIVLGGNKQRQRNLGGGLQIQLVLFSREHRGRQAMQWRWYSKGFWEVLVGDWTTDCYEPQGGLTSTPLAGVPTSLMATFMSQPQMCRGHQRRTEGQQSPCLKEDSKASRGLDTRRRGQVRPRKKGKCREMERGTQAAISPSSSVPLVIHPASPQTFILILALQNELKSSS